MLNTYVHQPCTTTLCNVPKYIIHGMYQSYASINMPTCACANMPTMCIHQYANHVHLPICQPCVISLMICLHHEPSTITMYQTNTNCCANQVIPMVYYHQAYAIQHASLLYDESLYMYAKSSIKHVPIKLLIGASTNVLEVYQS